MISMKKTVLGAALAMAFGAGAAQAATVSTTGNNFTMVSSSNGLTGGTNDVTFTWDGTYRTSVVTDNTSNATLASPTAFSGKKWTAHHVNIYGVGTYTFKSECVAGNASTGCTVAGPSNGQGGGNYTLTVGAGQVAAHMLFNWSTSTNIDVVVLWDMNKSWAATGTTSAFCTGNAGTANCATGTGNNINKVWDGVSIDVASNTVVTTTLSNETNTFSGAMMIDGPFAGQSANFNVMGIVAQAPVPVPAAAWLLGSGLLGLVGVARRKAA